ncbi:MAG: hypothetical protein Q7T87_03605 [Polaromonas sp.]|nr:hypothetical protein [Polaromonas sp.]
MNTAPAALEENLSINGKNRHQYFETAIATASDSDRLIRQAEARGYQRQMREEELKQKLRMAAGVFAVAVVLVGAAALWFVMSR